MRPVCFWNTVHVELRHKPLGTFFHLDGDGDMAYSSPVIVLLLGCHFNVPEPVGTVQIADRVQVPLQILTAVTPVPVADQSCRNYVDPFSNCLVVEIVVTCKLELDKFVIRAP